MGLLSRLRTSPLVTYEVPAGPLALKVQAHRGHEDAAKVSARRQWEQLQAYFSQNPELKNAPVSLPVLESAPAAVIRLSKASRQLGVLPMLCVPGALVEAVASDLAELSPEVVVGTEGDFHVIGDRARSFVVVPLTDRDGGLAIRVEGEGRYSIFLSHGRRQIPTPIAEQHALGLRAEHGAVASAVGSAMAEILHGGQGVESAMRVAKETPGIRGAVISSSDGTNVWGEIELVNPSEAPK